MFLTTMLFFLSGRAQPIAAQENGEDELRYKGQLSAWTGWSSQGLAGARYIPQLNLEVRCSGEPSLWRVDAEVAANIYTNAWFGNRTDKAGIEAAARLYRGWMRISANRVELRMGLQKINFGSAMMLRPLMWFDSMDPRDPLQLTEGVWSVLGRYYAANNINIWIWGLMGNKAPRPWDIGTSDSKTPEFGGRIQVPAGTGDMAFTFHRRKTDTLGIFENRYGLDLRLDYELGLWMEAAWINKRADMGQFTNQEFLTVGADYTFGLGNGLGVTVEHLVVSCDRKPFELNAPVHLSAFWVSYPLGISDNVSYMFYYDWKGQNVYNFLQWKHTFRAGDLYLMAFANPRDSVLSAIGNSKSSMKGTGFRLMYVLSHQSK